MGEEGDTDDLDEEEVEVLREAGVLPPESKKSRRKSHSKKGKHLMFAEDEAEGAAMFMLYRSRYAHPDRLSCSAKEYAQSTRRGSGSQDDDRMDVTPSEESVDLGWKVPEQSKRKRRKSKASAEEEETALDEASVETAEQAKVSTSRYITCATKLY